jgi:hypothetical protein
MHAYSIAGTPIVQSKDALFAYADLEEGAFSVDAKGVITNTGAGGSVMGWDTQKQVVDRGEPMWLCQDGDEWPSCSLILLEDERGTIEDEDSDDYGDPEPFPAEALAKATAAYDAWVAKDPEAVPVDSSIRYTIERPEAGWRNAASFTADEKARLRPIAETLAMLDGNAFFGMATDGEGDDVHYEQYLPEAAALAEANGGWADRASFVRGDTPYDENPLGLVMDDDAPGRVDLTAGDLVTVKVTGIEWDMTSGDGDATDAASMADLSALLPADLTVGVPADWAEGDRLTDLLSDHYGFCIRGIASSERIAD